GGKDDRVENWVQPLETLDRGFDELARSDLPAAHEIGLRRRVEEREIVGHQQPLDHENLECASRSAPAQCLRLCAPPRLRASALKPVIADASRRLTHDPRFGAGGRTAPPLSHPKTVASPTA